MDRWAAVIKLYDYLLSVNCYKQRLLLNILDVPYETVAVDFYPGWEHKSADFKKINPLGHIPVIDDDGYVLWDAHAILIYLASKYDPTGDWYPTRDPRRPRRGGLLAAVRGGDHQHRLGGTPARQPRLRLRLGGLPGWSPPAVPGAR